MNDDELKLLKKLFFELDIKGKGVITKEDLFRGMDESFDHKITKDEVNEIFSRIDYDNNGTISFDEFLKAYPLGFSDPQEPKLTVPEPCFLL